MTRGDWAPAAAAAAVSRSSDEKRVRMGASAEVWMMRLATAVMTSLPAAASSPRTVRSWDAASRPRTPTEPTGRGAGQLSACLATHSARVPCGTTMAWVHCASLDLSLARSEEHTSELQSRGHLVCRLLLEKKKNNTAFSLRQNTKKKTEKRTQ